MDVEPAIFQAGLPSAGYLLSSLFSEIETTVKIFKSIKSVVYIRERLPASNPLSQTRNEHSVDANWLRLMVITGDGTAQCLEFGPDIDLMVTVQQGE